MNKINVNENRQKFHQLIAKVDCKSLREFSLKIKVSELQLLRVIHGLLDKMPLETIIKIADGLNITLPELINLFSSSLNLEKNTTILDNNSLMSEYQLLRKEYTEQEQTIIQKIQLSTIQILESLLLQLPTFIHTVKKHPDFPAEKLLPLLNPLKKLLENWHIKAIANVGEQIAYNPNEHELMEGDAQEGDLVEVRYVGYKKDDELLYRAKVSNLIDN